MVTPLRDCVLCEGTGCVEEREYSDRFLVHTDSKVEFAVSGLKLDYCSTCHSETVNNEQAKYNSLLMQYYRRKLFRFRGYGERHYSRGLSHIRKCISGARFRQLRNRGGIKHWPFSYYGRRLRAGVIRRG